MEAFMNKKPSQGIIPTQGNVLQELTLRAKLFLHLMADARISPWLKLLPIGAILYLISPIDLIPDVVLPGIGVLDDAAILWLGYYTFLELCPPEVISEQVKKIISNTSVIDNARREKEDVVDGEATDITDK
jgi:uncharacterized membrane protein YkvA (DUF1232 family)